MTLEEAGVTAGSGPILVTGATGGVGGNAVAILNKLGFEVTALTRSRQPSIHAYLQKSVPGRLSAGKNGPGLRHHWKARNGQAPSILSAAWSLQEFWRK